MVYVNGQTGKTDGEVVTSGERLRSYAAAIFLATFLEFFAFVLFIFALNKIGPERIFLFWVLFLMIFAGSLTGNLPKKMTRERNGKNETVDMYADIDYVKKDFVKPMHIVIRRVFIGILLLPAAIASCKLTSRLSGPPPSITEAALITFVFSVIWTVIFMEIHLKKEKEQKPAEYNDYLNMSVTDILESSEQVY